MFMKTIILAFLAVGALAGIQRRHASTDFLEQIKDAVRQLCSDHGAADKFTEVENTLNTFDACIKGVIDPDTLKKEMDEARPQGKLDEVFKKYCDQSGRLKSCVHELLGGVSPHVDSHLHRYLPAAGSGADELVDFTCRGDGDKIAMFIGENGPECFKSKQNELKKCATDLKKAIGTKMELPVEESCAGYASFSACAVAALEQCAGAVPANMAEAALRLIRNKSQCGKLK